MQGALLPNLVHPGTPRGPEECAVVVDTLGSLPTFDGFVPRACTDIGTDCHVGCSWACTTDNTTMDVMLGHIPPAGAAMDMFDFAAGASMTGTRFAVLKNISSHVVVAAAVCA